MDKILKHSNRETLSQKKGNKPKQKNSNTKMENKVTDSMTAIFIENSPLVVIHIKYIFLVSVF